MHKKITRFSKKKNLGHRSRRRRLINFEKHDPYSLNPCIIKRRVAKDMRLYLKNRNPIFLKTLHKRAVIWLFIAGRYVAAISVLLEEMRIFSEKFGRTYYLQEK